MIKCEKCDDWWWDSVKCRTCGTKINLESPRSPGCSTADTVNITMDREVAEFVRDEMERTIERGADDELFGAAYDQLNIALSR